MRSTIEPHVREAMPSTPPWLNGLMRGVLRSPFSGLVDRGIALLTVTGTVADVGTRSRCSTYGRTTRSG